MPEPQPRTLTVGFVPGVTPGKWLGRWRDRHPGVPLESREYDVGSQESAIRNGTVLVGFVRLPVDREGLSVIPLYEEAPVVVATHDHELSLFDEVPLAGLMDETLLDVGECGGEKPAIEVAASGAGVVIVPMSIARLYSRKDAVFRPVPDAPSTTIAVAWLAGSISEDIEEFIGIVRGRTERSSRQPSAREPDRKAKKASKATARKPAAQQAGAQAGSNRGSGKAGSKGTGGKTTGRKPNPKGRKPGAPGRGRL